MSLTATKSTASPYQLTNAAHAAFARTNVQTIAQRVTLLRELLPDVRAIGELCCGDCTRQWVAYLQAFPDVSYHGLDIAPYIVAANQAQGIACTCGDVLDSAALRSFLACDVLFFGPPLSQDCDGHNLLAFHEVIPSYADFGVFAVGQLGLSRYADLHLPEYDNNGRCATTICADAHCAARCQSASAPL